MTNGELLDGQHVCPSSGHSRDRRFGADSADSEPSPAIASHAIRRVGHMCDYVVTTRRPAPPRPAAASRASTWSLPFFLLLLPSFDMEYLQARVASFARGKSKRVKGSSGDIASSPKWPHPASFKATPQNLAEAGFYYDPDSSSTDNVTCFMCGKHLFGWEEDDDPFAIHYDKCRDTCSWATVRCQRSIGEKGYVFWLFLPIICA